MIKFVCLNILLLKIIFMGPEGLKGYIEQVDQANITGTPEEIEAARGMAKGRLYETYYSEVITGEMTEAKFQEYADSVIATLSSAIGDLGALATELNKTTESKEIEIGGIKFTIVDGKVFANGVEIEGLDTSFNDYGPGIAGFKRSDFHAFVYDDNSLHSIWFDGNKIGHVEYKVDFDPSQIKYIFSNRIIFDVQGHGFIKNSESIYGIKFPWKVDINSIQVFNSGFDLNALRDESYTYFVEHYFNMDEDYIKEKFGVTLSGGSIKIPNEKFEAFYEYVNSSL